MNNPKFIAMPYSNLIARCPRRAQLFITLLAGLLLAAAATPASAGIAIWTGASGTDTNWSTGGNWSGGTGTAGVPGGGDNVVFGNVGTTTTIAGISNVVDSTGGNFGGYISALVYTNTTTGSFQNTLIAPGVTLNITNNTGPFTSALFAGSSVSVAAATVTASIQGAGATLNVNNTNACISISQAGANTSLGILNLTNLDNFTANVRQIAIGDYLFGIGTAAAQGSLFLAKSNYITTSWVGTFSSPYSTQMTNAIDIGIGSSSTLGSGLNSLFLGLTNAIFTDSINVGGVKSGGSATAPTLMAFVPAFTNSSPTAYFRGIGGNTSRISHWGVGDTAIGSGSSAQAFGKVDFTGGSVDIMVDTLLLGRDRNGTAALDSGIFTFTAGNVNVNTLEVGDQGSATTGSAVWGTMNVIGINGASPTLTVNTTLELGHTTLTGGPANALNTRGVLNIFNGTVNANNVIVGASSVTNIIAMNNATLVTANSLATNAAGVFLLTMTNSTLGFTINDMSLKGLVGTLSTGGSTNLILLSSVPVFASSAYPAQFALVKYTGAAIGGTGFNFGLTNVPASAPGAYLSNNTANKSIDLVLPTSPAPVITTQPQPFSGNPGNTVTLTVTNTGNPPLSYQWYYTNGVSTNALADGPGPSTLSTLVGSTSNVLTIVNAQVGDSGGYFAVISNIYGAATSGIAQVAISFTGIPPHISGLNNQTNIAGTTATISPSVSGNPFPTLQWQFNGNNLSDGPTGNGDIIAGSSTASLSITNLQYPSSQGTYSLIASNGSGIVTNSMLLTVIVTPVITNQPVSLVVTTSQSASFSVTAGGVPAPTYQWYKNSLGNPIASATSATFTIPSVAATDMATYFVVVANAAGSVTSSNVTLTVNSVMTTASTTPANGATSVCYDTPLTINFSQAPTLNNSGTIKIYNVTNSVTPVDTLNLALGNPQGRTIGGVTLNAYPVIINGNTANIYPDMDVLTSNQTYYVTIDDGVFSDATGAYFAGITATNAWQFTTKPTGPANPTNLVVAADGSGDFCTVQGAIDFVPSGNINHVLVNIRNGLYTEINRLNSKNNITFRGQSRHQTIISYANNNNINGGTAPRPMFGVLGANDIAMENLTLTNSTPKGGSQAEALYLNVVKRFIYYNADLDSYQDTLLVNANGDQAYFQDNHIQGDTDFIWGGGTAFFTNCEVETLTSGTSANYENITQARTVAGTNGFSFYKCQLTRPSNTITNGGLGRDLGFTDGNVAYINCLIDAHIVGWNTVDARYWEFGNSNITATATVSYNGTQLAATDSNLTNAETTILWLYGWQPQLAPNILTNPVSQSIPGSQSVTFTVSATGIPAPAYQWLKNGTNLAGQTTSILNIGSADVNDAGTYSVIVSNTAGSVTSGTATLAVGNTAPVFTPVADQTIGVGITLNVTNVVTDPDVPPQILTFALLSAPASATLGSSSGIFTWRAPVSSAGTTNPVTLTVTDNGSPNLSATQSFNVIVNPVAQPTASAASYANGQFSLTVNGDNGPDYILQTSTNLLVWQSLLTNSSPSVPFTFTDTNAAAVPVQFYRVLLGP
jgi:pectin methylesterase-like acyl-CoA thioesterase